MTAEQWQAIFHGLTQASADIKANKAPPASDDIDLAKLADTLTRFQAHLPAIIATFRSHQGLVTGFADVLAALSKAGVPHAADIETAVLAAPGALDAAEKWLPWILPFLSGGGMFAPAPRGGPPITEGEPWRGPQPVDNPSGAIGGASPPAGP